MVLVGIWSTGWMHWIERGANMDLWYGGVLSYIRDTIPYVDSAITRCTCEIFSWFDQMNMDTRCQKPNLTCVLKWDVDLPSSDLTIAEICSNWKQFVHDPHSNNSHSLNERYITLLSKTPHFQIPWVMLDTLESSDLHLVCWSNPDVMPWKSNKAVKSCAGRFAPGVLRSAFSRCCVWVSEREC